MFLNGQLVHAQSFKIDSLKGKKWELQLPKGKSYTSNLIFKDTTYTTSFSFNGQTHTIEKPYLIQQENVETFYVIFPSEGKGTKTFPVKFKVLEFTDKLLKLQNTTTNVVNTYFAK
ncbi:hypothetical protein DW064_15600 [Segatella copri]|uniref:Uncharacterized protein n=1 Tax=Segatella copri TaxID=165179 RepID=A0A3R6INP9_9BACT|nr:hypothetical protein DW192_15445 [Segatella copri]RHK44485.1 hypothetical protein DW064_15600 [Segatella copri]